MVSNFYQLVVVWVMKIILGNYLIYWNDCYVVFHMNKLQIFRWKGNGLNFFPSNFIVRCKNKNGIKPNVPTRRTQCFVFFFKSRNRNKNYLLNHLGVTRRRFGVVRRWSQRAGRVKTSPFHFHSFHFSFFCLGKLRGYDHQT